MTIISLVYSFLASHLRTYVLFAFGMLVDILDITFLSSLLKKVLNPEILIRVVYLLEICKILLIMFFICYSIWLLKKANKQGSKELPEDFDTGDNSVI